MALVASFAISFTSCEDALDTTNYTKANTTNFPARPGDVTSELAALYSVMNQLNTNPLQCPWFYTEVLSDNCYGSGGTGDNEVKAENHFTLYSTTMYDDLWKLLYRGIYRSNTIISTIDNVTWGEDKTTRNQDLGEAYFMRGLFYLWATQAFGDIPFVTTPKVPNPCPEQSAENVIFPQILSDLVSARTLMSGAVSDGHASKYAADALLARAYMYYEGFYKEAGEMAKANPAAITLVAQEGITTGQTLSKSDITDGLTEVINSGKFSLVGDFRNLWQYTNHLTVDDYKYTKDSIGVDNKKLAWAGNGNSEELFQVQYMNASNWNSPEYKMAFSNESTLFWGLRCGSDAGGKSNGGEATFPFGQGWGQGSPSANIWDDWTTQENMDKQRDIRKTASIIDCETELDHYAYVTDNCEDCGLAVKKYQPVTCKQSADSSKVTKWDLSTWWSFETGYTTCSNGNSMQGDHYEDTYLIRYADVLLMQTELTGNASFMNQVRARAGLKAKDYSWTNIQNERRWEFVFEGLRYNDLRRWSGINADANSIVCKALEAQAGKKINVCGNWTTMKHMTSSWTQRYIATKGFLPKPKTQIELANGAMTQNAGWDTEDAAYKTLY